MQTEQGAQQTPGPWVVLGEADAASVRIECKTKVQAITTVRTLDRFGFLCATVAKATTNHQHLGA